MKRLVFALLLTLAGSCAFAATPDILVIESYHSTYEWDKSYLEGIREVLGDRYRITNFEMNTKRLPKSLYQERADIAWQTYLDIRPDLVILGDDNALKLLGPRFLQTDTPVVYLGVNDNHEDYIAAGKNLTGILERPLFDFSIHTIAKLIDPRPEKVLLLFDHGTTSNASVRETFKGKTRQIINDVQVDVRMIGNWDLWKLTVQGSKDMGYDAIVVGLYHTLADNRGHNVPSGRVMEWTSENSPLPLFGFWDFSVGKGKTIGGFVLSGREQGQAAADVAKKILEGLPPENIPPRIGEKGSFVFSRSELDKYGIALPAAIRKNAILTD